MKKFMTGLAMCFAFTVFGNVATADIVLTVDDVQTAAGSSVSVDVTAFSNNPGGSDTLLSYDVPFDFGGDGFPMLPAGLTFDGATRVLVLPNGSNFSLFGPSIFEDELVTDSADTGPDSATITGTPTTLFRLNFSIASNVAVGTTFDLNILANGGSYFVANDRNSNIAGTPNNGSISVIPEPGSAIILLGGIVALVSRRRRV